MHNCDFFAYNAHLTLILLAIDFRKYTINSFAITHARIIGTKKCSKRSIYGKTSGLRNSELTARVLNDTSSTTT